MHSTPIDDARLRWTIEPLDRDKHDRAVFDCGDMVLNNWIRTKARQFDRRDLARVYVLVEQNQSAIKGYYITNPRYRELFHED